MQIFKQYRGFLKNYRIHLLKLIFGFYFIFSISAGATENLSLDGIKTETLTSSGSFISPNEDRVSEYRDVLKGKKGVLISVGTFRTLQSAGLGEFNDVFFFDADSKSTEFNVWQIQILAKVNTAAEFLATLAGTPQFLKVIEGALRGNETDYNFLVTAWNSDVNNLNLTNQKNQEIHERLIGRRYAENLLEISFFNPEQTFLNRPDYFDKIHLLAINNGLHALNGNLAGRKTLKNLGLLLKRMNLQVSVLDLSNAFEFISRDTLNNAWKTFLFGKTSSMHFLENLHELPFSKDGIINWTNLPGLVSFGHKDYNTAVTTPDGRNWIYFSMPAVDYIGQAEHFCRSKDGPYALSSYGSFIESLKKTQYLLNKPVDIVVEKSTCRESLRQ